MATEIDLSAVGSPSLGSRGLKLVVKNTMLEFQPVSSDSIDPEVEERDRRPKAFTDPPKASPKFIFSERRRSNSSEEKQDDERRSLRTKSAISTGTSLRTKSDCYTQYECDFECVEIASDTTDLDQFALPDVGNSWAAAADAGAQMVPQNNFSNAMYNGYALPNPGSPMNLPTGQWSPHAGYNGAPPLMPTHMPPPIQLEGKVEDLRAQAAAFEKAAENCKAAAAECDMLAGWASAAAHAPPYIPWSPMNGQMPLSFGMSSEGASPTHTQASQGSVAPSRSQRNNNAQSWGHEAEWVSDGQRQWPSSKEYMMPSSSSSGPAVASWRSGQSSGQPPTEALAKMDDDYLVVAEEGIEKLPQDKLTTVMLRNLPNDYTREMLLDLLDSQGFAKCYDFVYMPIDFHRKAGLGYAFVNMTSHASAVGVHERLMRFDAWETPSQKVLDVCWSEPSQGLEAHVERYRNSPVMHADVADKFKPLLFRDGYIITFPGPTKRIRPPRLKHGGHKS